MEPLQLVKEARELVTANWLAGLAAAVVALLVCLQLFSWLAARWQAQAGTPRGLRAEARRLARRGEHGRAGDLFRAAGEPDLAIEQYKAANLPNKAADVLAGRGHWGAAAALYERAQMWEPAADAFRRSGDLKRAETNYVRAGKKLLAARMYEEAGETVKAAQYYKEIHKHDRAAELFEKLGKAQDAADLYEKLYFAAASGLRERGVGVVTRDEVERLEKKVVDLRRQLGQTEKLLAFFLRAGLLVKAAELSLETGAAEKAVDLFLRAGKDDRAAMILERRGETLRAARIRGDLAARQGELYSAARHYEAAAEMRLAAETYERLGDEARAAETYEKAGDPGQAAFLYARLGKYDRAAELYEAAGDLDAALRCYETLRDEPRRAAILVRAKRYLRAGDAFLKLGKVDEAIAALQRVEPGDKDAAAATALLGLAFFEKGVHKLALDKLDEAVAAGGASSPLASSIEVFYARGRCLEALSQPARAAAEYERVLAIDFDYRDAADRLNALKRPSEKTSFMEPREAARSAGGGSAIERFTATATPPHGPAVGTGNGGGGSRLGGARGGTSVSVGNGVPDSLGAGASAAAPGASPPAPLGRPSSARVAATKLGAGRYKILEEIGRGGMGVVYKCEDTLLGRIVAYKVLSSQIRDFPAALENFLREAKSAARLNHPNIVTIYDFGESEGSYYMTLEYVSGKTLRQFLKTGPDPETVRKVLIGVCEGLAYAHSQNVVHRDVKPSNILVSEIDLKAKILDFGLAKVMEDVSQTASGVLGTPWYMSPEQVLGGQIDARTDIYSLGVTLFEVMTGELPFKGRDFGYHHVHTPAPAPRSVNPRVSPDLDAIISKCLQKKPEDRFQSAEEIRDAVRVARL